MHAEDNLLLDLHTECNYTQFLFAIIAKSLTLMRKNILL